MASSYLFFFFQLLLAHSLLVQANDWSALGTPSPNPGAGKKWNLIALASDSFNYGNKNNPTFQDRWKFGPPNFFKGPGATLYRPANAVVRNGNLEIFGSKIPASLNKPVVCDTFEPGVDKDACDCTKCFKTNKTVYTSYITSKLQLNFPLYTEASMKASRTPFSSNFWLISDDNEVEVDINENYGDTPWFRTRSATNIHFVKRGGDGNISDQIFGPVGVDLTQSFNRFGWHWKSLKSADFYFNGRKVRTINLPTTKIFDPSGGYMNRRLPLIFSLAAHRWRKEKGVPSDAQLRNRAINNMKVDWVRTYKAV